MVAQPVNTDNSTDKDKQADFIIGLDLDQAQTVLSLLEDFLNRRIIKISRKIAKRMPEPERQKRVTRRFVSFDTYKREKKTAYITRSLSDKERELHARLLTQLIQLEELKHKMLAPILYRCRTALQHQDDSLYEFKEILSDLDNLKIEDSNQKNRIDGYLLEKLKSRIHEVYKPPGFFKNPWRWLVIKISNTAHKRRGRYLACESKSEEIKEVAEGAEGKVKEPDNKQELSAKTTNSCVVDILADNDPKRSQYQVAIKLITDTDNRQKLDLEKLSLNELQNIFNEKLQTYQTDKAIHELVTIWGEVYKASRLHEGTSLTTGIKPEVFVKLVNESSYCKREDFRQLVALNLKPQIISQGCPAKNRKAISAGYKTPHIPGEYLTPSTHLVASEPQLSRLEPGNCKTVTVVPSGPNIFARGIKC